MMLFDPSNLAGDTATFHLQEKGEGSPKSGGPFNVNILRLVRRIRGATAGMAGVMLRDSEKFAFFCFSIVYPE